ncbi:signal transduction family protein (GGDEF domain protein) [Desulforapulum autotrophicum HRM2]|uniref:diguanylate cyclase n=1 Tax=Desulforapulum autotrophicum (strain ATCC 43914 / DSM 3382 / VKM B-1955 / HRM2) TaxID=177437 RepID=C0QA63_DESAH|nr:diguanylate cyclase [Desulforapulum autotrophicum]ACN14648.1 signal transduction family protein (GGDEF domain protein) [Desulforapulum autotrophicum HRM2]
MRLERQQLIRSLFDEYIEMYASRDDRLTSRFSDNFSGYAGSSDVLVTSKDEWVRITMQDFAQIPGRLHIKMLNLSLQDLAQDIVAITAFFNINLPVPEHILSRETVRLVLMFRCEDNDWKIVHSGLSIPYGLANDSEIYPVSRLEKRNLELEQVVENRTKELAEANRLLQIQTNTDSLTNIGNRRFFDQMLVQEWSRGQRGGTPLALIMLDIDHFKRFNDRYGHLAGDACLQALAKALAESGRRAGELAARYGGEEFAILLPNMDKQIVLETATQIHQRVLSLAIPHTDSLLGIVTVSIGVAILQPSNQLLPVELVRQADAALYRAKTNGRNCIQLEA